jgi:hypothetical protein
MKTKPFQFSLWSLLLVMLAANIVMSLWRIDLLMPSLAGVFVTAALLEWHRGGGAHFLILGIAAALEMIAGQFGVARWIAALTYKHSAGNALGILGHSVSFVTRILAVVGSVAWLMSNVGPDPRTRVYPNDQPQGRDDCHAES